MFGHGSPSARGPRCGLAPHLVAVVSGLLLVAPAPAPAAITLTEGANTVTTPKFELDFDDGARNVERLTTSSGAMAPGRWAPISRARGAMAARRAAGSPSSGASPMRPRTSQRRG